VDVLVQLLIGGLILGAIYSMVALGFNVILATTGTWHFAHGAVFTATAYFMYWLYVLLGWPFLVAAILCVPFAVVLGVSIELGVYRTIRRRGAAPVVLMVVAIAISTFIENMLGILFGTDAKNLGSGIVPGSLVVGRVFITYWQLIMVVSALVLFGGFVWFQRRTRLGTAMRALSSNREMAEIVGVDGERVYVYAFAIGSALAAPAAVLVASYVGMTTGIGFTVLLIAVAAVIVGGLGSVPGTLLGALFIGAAMNLGVWKIPTVWQSSIAFGVLLLFIVFRPTGFFGRKIRTAKV
jgi:branched-subunit amino acid ABC-type transport system permease component